MKLLSKIKRLFRPKKRLKIEISKEELIDGFKSTQDLSNFIRNLEQRLYEEWCKEDIEHGE